MKKRDGNEALDEITKPARMESIPELIEFVGVHAWEVGFADQKVEEIKAAVTEALENIINFACADVEAEVTVSCKVDETYALVINLIDTGRQFNMLVADLFPDPFEFSDTGKAPSLKKLKKTIKNIEYRRDAKQNRNILACIVPPADNYRR